MTKLMQMHMDIFFSLVYWVFPLFSPYFGEKNILVDSGRKLLGSTAFFSFLLSNQTPIKNTLFSFFSLIFHPP